FSAANGIGRMVEAYTYAGSAKITDDVLSYSTLGQAVGAWQMAPVTGSAYNSVTEDIIRTARCRAWQCPARQASRRSATGWTGRGGGRRRGRARASRPRPRPPTRPSGGPR